MKKIPHCLLVLLALTAWRLPAANEQVAARFAIDHAFPGGNIVVDRIEGDTVFLHQDLRDTEGWWFYWYFRVRGAAGRELVFKFQDRALGLLGPGISRDGGASWQWLGCRDFTQSFTYRFSPTEDEVRFSFGMPYQHADLARFLARHEGNPHLRTEILGQTRNGTPVERLRLGQISAPPDFHVLVTGRYHCCEMMASYVLEGLMQEILAGTEAGLWLRGRVEFVVIPMVDKDGVEAGDQGKNRRPHDHKADHRGPSIYPEVAALRTFLSGWANGKADVALDLHDPTIDGDLIYTHALRTEGVTMPGENAEPRNRGSARQFLETLERVQRGPLPFRVQDSVDFAARMAKKSAAPQRRSAATAPGATPDPTARRPARTGQSPDQPKITVGFEIPYAVIRGVEVNTDSARALGKDLALALAEYFKSLGDAPSRRTR